MACWEAMPGWIMSGVGTVPLWGTGAGQFTWMAPMHRASFGLESARLAPGISFCLAELPQFFQRGAGRRLLREQDHRQHGG